MTQIKVNYKYEIVLLLLKKEMHQRELAKELETSLTRIQSSLKELRNLNIVDYKEEGKNHTYFIKKNLASKSLILNAENYKLLKLLAKYNYLESIFEKIIKQDKDSVILLFGSYAKGNEKSESDLDIYIETKNQEIKEEVEKIYPSINVKIGKLNKEDLLMKEIIKNHVILNKGEEYYERIRFFE